MPNSLENEPFIIEKAKYNKQYFGMLYDFYYDKILKFCLYYTYSLSNAHDVTSNVFYKALKNIKKYKQTKYPFGTWLYKIARNESMNFMRHKKDSISIHDINESHLPCNDKSNIESENKIDQDIELQLIKKHLRKLKQIDQDLVKLHYFEQLKFKEIAAILNKSEATLRVKHHRLIKKLKTIIISYENKPV